MAAPRVQGEPKPSFEERAGHVLSQPGFQTDRPEQPTEARKGPSRDPTSDRSQEPGLRVSGEAVSLAAAVGWTFLGVAVVIALAALVRTLRERSARRASSVSQRAAASNHAQVALRAKPQQWQELAARGLHSEAVHCMLLLALQRLDVASAQGRALTSREVLGHAPMNPQRRGALEELIDAVERSLFGGAALGAADYERCVQAFERFGSSSP
jgi:hypothetical protein